MPLLLSRKKKILRIHGSNLYNCRCTQCVSGLGTLRKRKPNDCGNTKCGLCHSDKLLSKYKKSTLKYRVWKYECIAEGIN